MPGVSLLPDVVISIDVQAAMKDKLNFLTLKTGYVLAEILNNGGVLPTKYIKEVINLKVASKVLWRPTYKFVLSP